jgi:dimethylargininase
LRALVRRPSPLLADGLVSFAERRPVDVSLAERQWHGYVGALADAGWDVVEVEPAPDCPDGVFVEDSVVMYGNTAVLTLPGAPTRRAEVATVAECVTRIGCEVRRLEGPGTLDGGDVLKVGSTVYVGQSERTTADGVAEFASLLTPLGATVITAPVTKVLHLKSAVTALPDGAVIGWAPAVDDPTMFPSFLAMPEESGAHVVNLGSGRLLIAADAPRTAELLADRGYTPVPVDISEFVKLDGCVTCLSVRLRG